MKSRKVKANEKHKRYIQKKIEEKKLSSDEDFSEHNEDSLEETSSEDEYQKNTSSEEEEVLPITGDTDSDVDEEEGLPNREAWGKRKSSYYNADFIDKDRGRTYREEDAENARAEEEEALYLQKNFQSLIAFKDFKLKSEESDKEEPAEVNLNALDKDGKLKYLKKKSPELFVYINEFKEKVTETIHKLLPILELIKNGTIGPENKGGQYIKLRYQLLLNYCENILFYLYLKSSGCDNTHPVVERLSFCKQLIEQTNPSDAFEKEIKVLLKKISKKEEILLTNKAEAQNERFTDSLIVDEDGNLMEEEQMDDESGGKRIATYQILKNKGLIAKRKKECRNPRVHHRMKFKKAKIRRKGQVREVVKEIKRYDGEPTGISSHVVRSIKLK